MPAVTDPVLLGAEEPVDHLLVGVRRLVAEESVLLLECGREPDQVEVTRRRSVRLSAGPTGLRPRPRIPPR